MAKVIWRTGKITLAIIVPLVLVVVGLYGLHRLSVAQTNEGVPSEGLAWNGDALSWLEEGKALRRNSQYVDSHNVCLATIEQYPDTSQAVAALVELARVVPYSGDDANAERFWKLAAGEYAGYDVAAEGMKIVADEYVKCKKYALAQETYRQIIEVWPRVPEAAGAQGGLAVCCIHQGDDKAARFATGELFNRFGTMEGAGRAAYDIVLAYCDAGNFEDAWALAEEVLSEWPESSGRVWGQAALAAVNLRQDRGEDLQLQVSGLLNEWDRNGEWSRAAYRLGQLCLDHQRFNMAYLLCHGASLCMSEVSLELARDVIYAQIGLGDIAGAQGAVDRLMVDYADDVWLVWRLTEIANSYQAGGHAAQAQDLYEYVIDSCSETRYAVMESLTQQAIYNIQRGDYKAARWAADRISTEYTENSWVPLKLLAIGWTFQIQGKVDDAMPLYEQVVASWPERKDDCLNALTALSMCYVAKGQPDKAKEVVLRMQEEHGESPWLHMKLFEIAQFHREAGWVDEALGIYQRIEQRAPESTDDRLNALTETAVCYMDQEKPEAAHDVLVRMVAEFGDNGRLPEKVARVAHGYLAAEHWDWAITTDQYLVDTWPQGSEDQRLRAREGIAVAQIRSSQPELALKTTEQIINAFRQNYWLSDALLHIANEHRDSGNIEAARDLYEYVEANWPDDDVKVLWAQFGQFACSMAEGDVATSANLCASLKDEFANNWHFPIVLTQIANTYQHRGSLLAAQKDGRASEYFALAAGEAQQVIARASNAWQLADAYFILGDIHRFSDEPEEAIEAYRIALEYIPRHRYAWHMWFLIGRSYQELKAEGVISAREADEATTAAYGQIVERFPRCPAFKAAQNWLKAYAL